MEKTWNILDILNWTTGFLEKKNIEEAKYKAELLLSHVLELKRFELYLNFDRPLSKKEREDFKLLLNRLTENEPIQYILGKWEFYGYDFFVNKDVLIPRRETEELVEKVINYIKESPEQPLYILDIGTGSGAIIISLYKEIIMRRDELHSSSSQELNPPTPIKFIAIDISEKALNTAKENAKLNGITEDEIKFINSNLLDELVPYQAQHDSENNNEQINYAHTIMIFNPPYVSISEYNNLKNELFFEPKNAITDNDDGLYFYIKLIKEIKERKIKKSFFEIGYNQKEALTKICKENGIDNFKFYKDLSDNWRMLEI